MPLGKLMCWVCMAFFVFVVVLLTLEDDTRQALLVTPLWFICIWRPPVALVSIYFDGQRTDYW